MHNLGVVDPPRDFLEQDVMPDIVEKGAQVKIKHPSLVVRNRVRDPRHRLMRRPLGPVAVRTRLEISLEDGLKDELERALNHAVANGRNRKRTKALASA